ncbi:MAG: 7-cyano-7-deazaguanine synthase QueC [bacterium]|nr:7-cyano-7-deazaguanine synthase QueC [bacterium]
MDTTTAVVLFSGGQDSTTCLAWALERFDFVECVSIEYGQRHAIEMQQARVIASMAGVPIHVLRTDAFEQLTQNALTNHGVDITAMPGELPSTFVPGRNHMFISLAAIYAYQKGIRHIVTGVCQTDYSGYPDCRDAFVQSLATTLGLAMDTTYTIHTPLMWLTKAKTVLLMRDLGRLDWYAHSHTCYEGKRPACGKCPACELRRNGFKEAGIQDPLDYE